jgi:hypothetical protein
MGRGKYLLAAAILVVVAAVAVFVAAHTSPSSVGRADSTGSGRTAPALDAKGWINSPPLSPADLKNKVVVYDF